MKYVLLTAAIFLLLISCKQNSDDRTMKKNNSEKLIIDKSIISDEFPYNKKFVEVNGKSKPLEVPFFKGHQKLWDQHKIKVSEKVTGLAETLKAVMLIPDGGPKKEIVKVNSDW